MEQSTLKRHRKYLRKHFGELEGCVAGEAAERRSSGPEGSGGRLKVPVSRSLPGPDSPERLRHDLTPASG